MARFDEMETEEFDDEFMQETFGDEPTEEFEDQPDEEDDETEPLDEEDENGGDETDIMPSKSTNSTHSKSRTTSGGGGGTLSYDQAVNMPIVLKRLAPWLTALILIAAMVAGAFFYFKLGYQDTMEQIQQIIQGVNR